MAPLSSAMALALPLAAAQQVDWVQTARFKDGSMSLLKEMPALQMEPMPNPPEDKLLEIDTSKTYQEILGFGGAFTEASAINWRKLSKEDQDEVIRLYFAPPEEGGHGYTLGRVPINSCDFSPASYDFDGVKGDFELEHFDHDVTHDVEVGMIPMIQQASAAVKKRGYTLNVYASPWSPPAWMKEPVWGQQSMLLSASPNGLMPSMQRVWAKYFSKFLEAYKAHDIDMWGVTVQNEPEAAVGWEACLWTPEYMASFVRDHLGPVLAADHPGVKIIGFDHNKDHVDIWAKGLYEDKEAAAYFYGIGVHWYGGLNTQKLDYTHNLDPSKVILATEACNCGGVVYKDATFAEGELTRGDFLAAWWSRAESLALDILEDLRYWSVGWTDWNLILSTSGGPNHLKNLCDANIIADPEHEIGSETLIMQASYYYMGHFSRYLPPGAKRLGMTNTVEAEGGASLQPGDVKDGQSLLFAPCDGSEVQKWQWDDSGAKSAGDSLRIRGTEAAESSGGYEKGGECMDVKTPGGWPKWVTPPYEAKLFVWACDKEPEFGKKQTWKVVAVSGGSQIKHAASGQCVTAVPATGEAVGLDKGVKVVAAQLAECLPAGTPSQTFITANYDAQGFPFNFPIKTLPSAPGGGELCLQPQIVRMPHFDAVAFETGEGGISLVAMNTGDKAVEFSVVDKATKAGLSKLSLPPHSIHTYRWTPTTAPIVAASSVSAAATAATVAMALGSEGSSAAGGVGLPLLLVGLAAAAVAVGSLLGALIGMPRSRIGAPPLAELHDADVYEEFHPKDAL